MTDKQTAMKQVESSNTITTHTCKISGIHEMKMLQHQETHFDQGTAFFIQYIIFDCGRN